MSYTGIETSPRTQGTAARKSKASTRLLLQESSFARCQALSMTRGRLDFELLVDSQLRQAELLRAGSVAVDQLLDRLARGASTRVTLSGSGIRFADPAKMFKAGQLFDDSQADAEIAPARWEGRLDGEGQATEGSSLVLVGFEREQPVGYIDLTATVVQQDKRVELLLGIESVCVNPFVRNNGYSIDLSLSAGLLAADLLVALYSSVRHGTTIAATIRSELASERVKLIARQIHRSLKQRADLLNKEKRRPSIAMSEPQLTAGS